ncbi:PilZ domain-containing protein [Lachnospiraceae bacterium XBB2008]|nr:PilZ domain-containing protein [Lachnospiraceae bacterium]SCY43830.1 PilZ domain-containing protein [Lachnospiraceae bacterium XBB2008]
MEERRKIDRVEFPSNTVIVVCDTQEKIYCRTENVSPLGMGIRVPAGTPEIQGMDVIVVAETLIMYADVLRQEKQEDGTAMVGVQARRFTPDVLQYLFDHVGD